MALRDLTKQVSIPHEDGEWMELRLLGWQELEESKRAKTRESFENIKALGGDIYKAIQEARTEDTSGSMDPLALHDMATLLRKGIVAWSYGGVPVNAENIGRLDEKTATWAARAILGIDDVESRKNGSDSSTGFSTVAEQHPMTG